MTSKKKSNLNQEVEVAVKPLRAEIRRLRRTIVEAQNRTAMALQLTMDAQRMTTEAQAYAAKLEVQLDGFSPESIPKRPNGKAK